MGMEIGGARSADESRQAGKVEDQQQTQAADKIKDKQLEAQTAGQGGTAAVQQYMQQLLAQQQAQQEAQSQTNPLSKFDVGTQMKARNVSAMVVQSLMEGMPSQKSAQNGNTNNQGAPNDPNSAAAADLIRTAAGGVMAPGATSEMEAGAGASSGSGGGSGGLGSASSKDTMEDGANKNLNDAAKVAVYNDIYNLLQKMQNTRQSKSDLEDKIHGVNDAIAGKHSGDTVKVPVYDVDSATGKTTFKGYKDMDYDQAVAMRDKLQDTKDSMSEMSQDDMFYLQQAMEQKSQLEQMISNTMKAASETQSGLAANLKAS